jgi:TadE-like protein
MAPMVTRNRRRRSASARKATAAVECALVLPIIFLLAFSTLEICSALYLRQSATTIAFEGARVGVRGKTTRQQIIDECTSLLTQRGIVQGEIAVIPSDFSTIKTLDPITVTVRAPCRGNTWFLGSLFQNQNIQASVTMAREYGL